MLSAFPRPRVMLKMNDRTNKKTYAVNARQASLFIVLFGQLLIKMKGTFDVLVKILQLEGTVKSFRCKARKSLGMRRT